MSEIKYNREATASVVSDLATLSDMVAKYTSFAVPTGQNRGYPQEALAAAADAVAALASAERDLIRKIIDNIVADVADLEGLDEEMARSILKVTG